MASATNAVPWDHSLDKRGNAVIAAGSAMLTLSTLVVAARLYTRIKIVKKVGIEEGFIIFAWVFACIVLAVFNQLRYYGLGHHANELDLNQLIGYFKWFWVLIWTYNVSLNATKFSIVLQYQRIFVTEWFQRAVKVMLVILTIYSGWTVFGCVFICWPIEKFWMPSMAGKCMQKYPVFIGNSYMNIFTDLMIIVSPMPVLSSLHMPKRQKIMLGGVFAAGAIICVFSIIRLKLLFELVRPTADNVYSNYEAGMWSTMEINVAIITASAPSLRALFVHLFPSLGSSGGGSKPTYNKSGDIPGTKARGTINVVTHFDMEHEDGVMVRQENMDEEKGKGGKVNVSTTIRADVPPSSSGGSSL